MMPHEYKQINGLWYQRGVGNPFWYLTGHVRRDDKRPEPWEPNMVCQPNTGDQPTVVCGCGGVLFTLRQGNCVTDARCTACGAEETVHDG
jgi:hypothetical protein